MKPLTLRRREKPSPPPQINPWTSLPYGHTPPRELNAEEIAAQTNGTIAALTRNAPTLPEAGFAPGTGIVPSEAMYALWERKEGER